MRPKLAPVAAGDACASFRGAVVLLFPFYALYYFMRCFSYFGAFSSTELQLSSLNVEQPEESVVTD